MTSRTDSTTNDRTNDKPSSLAAIASALGWLFVFAVLIGGTAGVACGCFVLAYRLIAG